MEGDENVRSTDESPLSGDIANAGCAALRPSEECLLKKLEEVNSQLEQDSRGPRTYLARTSGGSDNGTSTATTPPSSSPAAPASPQQIRRNSSDPVGTTRFGRAPKDPVREWSAAIKDWDVVHRKRFRQIIDLTVKGIPTGLRGMVWTLLVSTARTSAEAKRSTDGVHDDTPKEAYPVLMERDSPHEKLIVRDIARTYPGNAFFQDGVGQETLLRVIKAYANYDIEVGYCQGSPFIVGALLLHVPEEDAFDLFVTMMREYKLRGLFRPSMADLPLRLFQFNQLFSQIFPELYAHFEDISVPVSSFASQWFLSMFGTVLPLEAVFRILDLFLLDTGSPTGNFGMLVIFRVGLAILGGNYDYLLMANFESIMAFMSPKDLAQRYENSVDDLIKASCKYNSTVTAKRLMKAEKDYELQKEAESREQSEITRLRTENAALLQANKTALGKIAELETENSALAENLTEKCAALAEARALIADLSEADAVSNSLKSRRGTEDILQCDVTDLAGT
eukprot:m.462155 g.462155  ORF g.462155 m.462155 type:complete len:508 (-) comp22532_c0_seq1:77-1600(-)